jgi:hypothetical protein
MTRLDRRPIRRFAALLAAGIVLFSGALAFAGDLGGFQTLACKVPGIRSVCGSAGWGGAPSHAQDKAWRAAAKRDDGEGLRGYLRRWPRGAYARQARARLAGCRMGEVETWVNERPRLPLNVGFGVQPMSSEAAARTDAITRGTRDGEGLCVAYGRGEFRLASAEPVPSTWRCQAGPAGQACGFEGEVICHIEARRIDIRELCRP